MSARLLLEIGVEEMPASAARAGLRQLADNARRLLSEYRLLDAKKAAPAPIVLGTPRRLTLIVEDLPDAQESVVKEMKGPPVKIAFGEDGTPLPAAIGFAKTQGIDVNDLEIREADGGKYLYATTQSIGLPTVDVLPEILAALVGSLEFTKAMRWGTGRLKFIRPLRWLLALYGSELVEFELEGLKSSCRTYGHRFLAEGPFDLTQASEYEAVMREGRVDIDHVAREARIREMITTAAAGIKGEALRAPGDSQVLDEVTFLVEEPHVVIGEFDEEFLQVPRAALVTAMKSHQRYFPIEGAGGELMAKFAVVHNGDPAHDDQIRRGHERVLRARLADAAFFFTEDTKKTLESRVDSLKSVVWQAKLGTIFEKTTRVRTLAGCIARELDLPLVELPLVDRAAMLAKADLTTAMVIEFTDLQGVIGREYALVDGEDKEVARAIGEHYWPRFAGDDLPGSTIGQVTAVADKLDTLAGCFLAGLVPTGSADPYSLRRQAAGLVQILAQTEWSFVILDIVRFATDGYQGAVADSSKSGDAPGQLHEFIMARLRRWLTDAGSSGEAIEAVLAAGHDIVAEIIKRVRLLDALDGKKELEDVKVAFTRCQNLARADLGEAADQKLFEDASESALFEALGAARVEIGNLAATDKMEEMVRVLAALRPPIDQFFEEVMVMAEDERVKNNRLRLLNQCVGLSQQIADFSKLP